MTIKFVRKLEVVHKEVGGCLISYNLQLACVKAKENKIPQYSFENIEIWKRENK